MAAKEPWMKTRFRGKKIFRKFSYKHTETDVPKKRQYNMFEVGG